MNIKHKHIAMAIWCATPSSYCLSHCLYQIITVCFEDVCLTVHLSLEELDEGLCEGQNPFVHDVVALLCRVFIVQELNVILLTEKYTRLNTHTQKHL